MFFGLFVLSMAQLVLSQISTAFVCIPGQCAAGKVQTTVGVTLSAADLNYTIQLLPGQYVDQSQPPPLHVALTDSSPNFTPSPGFGNSSSVFTLPLTVALNPGAAAYPLPFYSGHSSFMSIPPRPNNPTYSLSAGSLIISSNTWVIVRSGNNQIALSESIPDIRELPSTISNPLSVVSIQSSACSPPCSASGVCASNGTCSCLPGFSGPSCEECMPGYFGSSCSPCPNGCSGCDDGIGGTGRCSGSQTVPSNNCNCANGVCDTQTRQCQCMAGWTNPGNGGVACSVCSPGYFLTNDECKLCGVGCASCSDGSGTCTNCYSNQHPDPLDPTTCFSDDAPLYTCTCTACISNPYCMVCPAGLFKLQTDCVQATSNGNCQGQSGLFANSTVRQCQSCGGMCASCMIPNFNAQSTTASNIVCTECLPGHFVQNGQCVSACGAGSYDTGNSTCAPCNAPCSSCANDPNVCLSCTGGQAISKGKCVDACPTGTYQSANSTCMPCHPDCATCSGSGINQCASCGSQRPVLSDGRCLLACGSLQYYDGTSSCQACDSSCSSCAGPGPGNCLACSSSGRFLRNGFCVDSSCDSSAVVPGLGVCLTQLSSNDTSGNGTDPQSSTNSAVLRKANFAWWKICLISIGALTFVVCLGLLWRCRARRRREEMTNQFVHSKSTGFIDANMRSDYHPPEGMYGMRESERLRDLESRLALERRRAIKRRRAMERRMVQERHLEEEEHEIASRRELERRRRERQRDLDGLGDGVDRKRQRRRSDSYPRGSRSENSYDPARNSVTSILSYYNPSISISPHLDLTV